jgi:tetratricopeptide (TPR) repeat protein
VNFSDQQKEQIKTMVQSGKVLDAQKLILKEVESQVGGTAVAGATGFDRMRVALGNVAEDLGGVLIPYVERFANFVIDKVVPVIEQFSTILGERGLGGAFNYLVGSIVRGVWNMGKMGKTITVVIGLFGALKVAVITYTAVQTALAIAAKITTGALNAQIVALNATKTAMLAAGGVTALLTVAASLYAIYATNKSKATTSTRQFSEALFQEGEAQTNAVVELVKSQKAFQNLATILNMTGQGVGAFEEYLNTGSGALAQLKERIDAAAKSNRAMVIFNTKGQGFTIPAKDVKVYQKALEDLMSKQTEYKDLQKVLKGLGINTDPTPLNTLNNTVETAAEKFKKFGDAAKAVVSDQKNLRDAFKNTVTVQKSLQTATDNVAAAQAKLNKIASGYGAGSTEAQTAQEGLNRANRDATQAGYDLTKANYAVSDAEKALEQARRRNNPREIAEAEIALAEARFAQEDAQKAVADATVAVNTAQTNLNETINGAATTSDTYKNALIELQEAQNAQVEAIDNVRTAKERELEVTRNLAKAEILLRKAKGGLTKSQMAAANKLLKQLNTPVTVTVPSPTAGVGSTGSTVSMPSTNMSGFDWSGISVGGLATLAEGGIAMKPTFALIAEGGEPEAVIPLSKMGAMGGDTIINVTVTSADPNAVVDALRRYQRQNGALPLRVQG